MTRLTTPINMSQFGVCNIPPGYSNDSASACVCVCVCRNKDRFVLRLHAFILFCMCDLGKIWDRSVEARATRLFLQARSNWRTPVPTSSGIRSISDSSPLLNPVETPSPSDLKGWSPSRLFVSLHRVVFQLSSAAAAAYRLGLNTFYFKLHVRVRRRAFLPL